MPIHRFKNCLARSAAHSDKPWWQECYRSFFPRLVSMATITHPDAQRRGVDRVLILDDGKHIEIDEKVRFTPYLDVLLEFRSDDQRNTPGWVERPLSVDYIAYASVPFNRCILLPVDPLQRTWRQWRRVWRRQYPLVRAESFEGDRTWETLCVPVPLDVLMRALTGALCYDWQLHEEVRPMLPLFPETVGP